MRRLGQAQRAHRRSPASQRVASAYASPRQYQLELAWFLSGEWRSAGRCEAHRDSGAASASVRHANNCCGRHGVVVEDVLTSPGDAESNSVAWQERGLFAEAEQRAARRNINGVHREVVARSGVPQLPMPLHRDARVAATLNGGCFARGRDPASGAGCWVHSWHSCHSWNCRGPGRQPGRLVLNMEYRASARASLGLVVHNRKNAKPGVAWVWSVSR